MSTCPACGHIWRATMADHIGLLLRERGVPTSRHEIERELGHDGLGVNLQRAIDKGLVRKVDRGLYEAVTE